MLYGYHLAISSTASERTISAVKLAGVHELKKKKSSRIEEKRESTSFVLSTEMLVERSLLEVSENELLTKYTGCINFSCEICSNCECLRKRPSFLHLMHALSNYAVFVRRLLSIKYMIVLSRANSCLRENS